MQLEIVKYGHPVLRKKGQPVAGVTPALARLAEDMIETMQAGHGVGLAAQQVGRAVQLMVVDVRGVTDRPSSIELGGQEARVDDFMPMVLFNPAWKAAAAPVDCMEGCLSFPDIFAEIRRAARIDVEALDIRGQRLSFRCGGLIARVIQHEFDHLQGILFIDRMMWEDKDELRPQLEALRESTQAELAQRAVAKR